MLENNTIHKHHNMVLKNSQVQVKPAKIIGSVMSGITSKQHYSQKYNVNRKML